MADPDERQGGSAVLQDARESAPARSRGRMTHAGDVDSRRLGNTFGGRWTGIRLLWEEADSHDVADGRLCELIGNANGAPTVLTAECCSCPGCSYALGWRTDAARVIAAEIHQRLAMTEGDALALVESLPRLQQPPHAVVVGLGHDADVYVSYAQPFSVMKLVRRWQAMREGDSMLRAELSSVMSVCSGALLAAYLHQRPALTFGCPESRKVGGLSRDRLALAVPASLVADLTR